MAASLTLEAQKPRFRGYSHQIAFFVAVFATAWLVSTCRTRAAATAATVFGLTLITLFGVSALYHRVQWSKAARLRMRRLDHAAIFLLIGGGYTPLFSLVGGRGALLSIWIGASIGVLKSLLWPNAPKWMTALLCVGLGWVVVGQVIARAVVVGWPSVMFLVASGTIYSLGAVVYALKRPDPWPRTFGYHEVFHALVIVASMTLVAHVATVLAHAG
ncbi:MAG: PAQR family membrane homeostasis protein TrhA [Polyangiales bacterium]